ncbi:MAG TPA: response regulator [Holophaga sp.]|nr:response regulator [Holophaga sp.]
MKRLISLQVTLPLVATLCLVCLGGGLIAFEARTAREEALARARVEVQAVAREEADHVRNRLEGALGTARNLAAALASRAGGRRLDRASAIALLERTLQAHPDYLATYTLWEPGAFDGRDGSFRGRPGHDATGRFIPYVSRSGRGIAVEPIREYDDPVKGVFYALPRATRREAALEPYRYEVQGEEVLMTSLIAPILEDGAFLGMAGVDLRVDFLQKGCDEVDLYGGAGRLHLLTPEGRLAGSTGHPERIGQDAGDLKLAGGQAFLDGKDRIFASVPVPIGGTERPWTALLEVPAQRVTAAAEARTRALVAAALALIAAAVLLMVLLLRRLLLVRMRALSQATRAFAEGDLAARAPVLGGDELAEMAEAFNAMAGRVQATLEELGRNRLLLRVTLDHAFQMYGLLDGEGRILEANRAALELVGTSLDQVRGRPIHELPWWAHDASERSRIAEALDRARAGTFVRLETTHRDPGGAEIIVDFSLSPWTDPLTGSRHIIAEGRDITAIRAYESALAASEARYRHLVEKAPFGIFQRTIRWEGGGFANRALLEQFGYPDEAAWRENPQGDKEAWVDAERRDAFAAALMRDGAVQNVEAEFKAAGGGTRWVLLSTFVEDGGQTVLGFTVDITSLKAAQADRERLVERLHHGQRLEAIGQLAGGIAHDFNNVLGGILGAAELMEDPRVPETQRRRYLELMKRSAGRAADLTQKLLAFGRKGIQPSQRLDGAQLVEDALEILRRTIDRRILTEVVRHGGRTTLMGDAAMLENVFINMGINASHAMPEGGRLTFELAEARLDEAFCKASPFGPAPGAYLCVSVRDTGHGMPPEVVSRIFEPFFTTKDPGKGTGLGLAAAYGTIREHGGAISVYSEVGAGTVFHVYLPLTDQSAADPAEEVPVTGSGTILLVEDEEILRLLNEQLLMDLGYGVITAQDGREAVEAFAANPQGIDLVLLDMIMPLMGGRETFERMREIRPDVKVILCSGFSRDEDLAELERQGLAGFVRKPFRQVEISRVIAGVLRP